MSLSRQARRRPAVGVIRALVRAYQLLISPVLPSRCIHTPSCSAYMIEAVETHGAIRGVWLGLKRLLRCHPFSRGGYDPVPKPTDPMAK